MSPRIMAIIVSSLVFSQYIKESGLGEFLASNLGGAAVMAAFLVPFLIGLATGVEFTFAALAFPPLSPLLHGHLLAVAFLGGFLGVMLSPAHSCFVLSAEHFRCEMRSVYGYLFKAVAVEIPIAAALIYLLMTL
ncbi:MAG: DUF401 family protein [Nitrososphaerota archaeon]